MSVAYDDWTKWSLLDIIEYADELSRVAGLTDDERLSLRNNMWSEAGFGPWDEQGPMPRCANQPSKPPRYTGIGDEEWMELAIYANRPIERATWDDKVAFAERNSVKPAWAVQGDGLTRRWVMTQGPFLPEKRARLQRNPFSFEASSIYARARALLWETGHFEYTPYDGWIGPKGMNEPHIGLYWLYMRIVRWRAACQHFSVSDTRTGRSRAMYCALRLGQTYTEMELRAAHNEPFKKAQRTREEQSAAGKRNQVFPAEVYQAAWHRHRSNGLRRVAAGEAAAMELGVSEKTIRNAFPDGKYPS